MNLEEIITIMVVIMMPMIHAKGQLSARPFFYLLNIY